MGKVSLGLTWSHETGSRRSYLVSHPFRGGTMKPRLRLQPPTQQAEVCTHFSWRLSRTATGGSRITCGPLPRGGQLSTYGAEPQCPHRICYPVRGWKRLYGNELQARCSRSVPPADRTATFRLFWAQSCLGATRLSSDRRATVRRCQFDYRSGPNAPWLDVPIPEECLYSCARRSNSSAR